MNDLFTIETCYLDSQPKAITDRLYKLTNDRRSNGSVMKSWLKHRKTIPVWIAIARIEGEIVGWAGKADLGVLEVQVFVDPDFRNCGISTALVQEHQAKKIFNVLIHSTTMKAYQISFPTVKPNRKHWVPKKEVRIIKQMPSTGAHQFVKMEFPLWLFNKKIQNK